MRFGRPSDRRLGRTGLVSRLAALAAVLTLSLASAAPARADAADVGAKTFDVLVLRTLGAVQTAVGACLFVVAGPLSAPGGGWNEAWDVFVGTPYQDTFRRPLGSF